MNAFRIDRVVASVAMLFASLAAPLMHGSAFAQESSHPGRAVHPHASSEVASFVHSTGAYALQHPTDWTPHESGLRLNLGPEDGLVAGERGYRTIYGVIVVVADDPAAGKDGRSIDVSTRSIVDAVLQRNPHQALSVPVHLDGTLGGAPSASAVLIGTSPVTGRGERAEIVARHYGSQVLYLILVSPVEQYESLEAPLQRIRHSLRVLQERP